ncbi:SusC/RagA family TonB-linked outer membrane protein [Pedobacter hartonius]|uniref:TonB-linked outer membrane protein, SusC/RagA family n=1 Tax=Pedobacter hartonius TaxID=425514 RepID=A0A1H4DTA1_9SPHI|nr:TonB-dependent receptor [Pedobacter hartonius]SEA75728.1 TonB-linked outer membrane protein, SusC/RagA family [Pedobacter hartonius]
MMKNRLIYSCSSKLRTGKIVLTTLLLLLCSALNQDLLAAVKHAPITITGKVTDSRGETLIGVSVRSSAGPAAVTDAKGVYTLRTEDNATLTFSYIGYAPQEVKVSGRAVININLSENASQLNDVVVVGYGTQKRKDVTGAVTTIRLEDSPKSSVPYVNALEALQGTSGINVGPSTSAGANPNIVVRGQNSVNANTSPLIVLDGVIYNGNLNEINMNDIATYDILKDASSAAIYGSKSANGVVLITTKRGRTDAPTINFSTYYGIQNATRIPEMRTGEDFLQWRKDNMSIRGQDITDITKVLTPLELKAYNEGHNMDWIDEVMQYAPIQNYQVSISGKTDKMNYYFSGGYLDQKGIIYNDKFKKPNFTLKLENNITDWLSYGATGYYSSTDYSGVSPNLYMATYLSPFSYKYVDGTNDQLLQRYPAGNTSLFNPFWGNGTVTTQGYYDDNLERSNSIRGTGFLNAKIPFIKGLNFRFDVTGNRANAKLASFHHEGAEVNTLVPAEIANPLQFLSKANGSMSATSSSNWLINNLLSYTHSFGKHNIDALAGYTRDYTRIESLAVSGSDFAAFGTTSLGYNGLYKATTQTILNGATTSLINEPGNTGGYSKYQNVGYIGRLNYNYAQKYYATLNIRRDGYSAFSEGNKFGWFPGGSVAWALSEENFMKSLTFINYLKVRASYGKTGNQGISPYATQALIGSGYTVFGSTSTAYSTPSSIANNTLTWEKTAALNFGLDFSLFDNRLSGNIDVYKSKTTDQLLTRYIPIFTGFQTVNANIGEVQNKGIEITFNSVNLKTDGGFRWESGYNFWLNRNKLVHLYGLDVNKDGKEDDDIDNSLFIGKSLGAIYDYTVDGVVQSSDTEYMNKYKTATGTNIFVPGDLKIRDLNGDGVIDPKDRSVIGYGKENYNMNLSNTFTYKNFQLFFSINAIIGGGKDNFFMSTNIRGLDPGAVLPTVANWLNKEYWTPAHESTTTVRPNYANTFSYGFYQSRTFARLQNASLSYTFPKKVTEKLKINNLKVFVSGTNLFTLTGWTGLDPANGAQIGGNGGSSNTSVNTSLPLMRTVSFGLNLGF